LTFRCDAWIEDLLKVYLHDHVAIGGGHHGGHGSRHGLLQPPPHLPPVAAAVLQVVGVPNPCHVNEAVAPPRAVVVPGRQGMGRKKKKKTMICGRKVWERG